MKAFFRRLTWGFLPEGWRRIVLIVLPIVGTHYLNEIFPKTVTRTVTPILDNGEKDIENRRITYKYIREIEIDDFILAVIATILLSFIASWIADGFKKTST